MRTIRSICCLLIASFAASNASADDMPSSPRAVLQQLQQAGYQEVRDLDFDDGLWEAEVRRDGGRWREIAIHPDTGEIYDAHAGRPVLSRSNVLRALQAQGYGSVKQLERSGALWKAEVRDADLQCFDVTVSGYNGTVLNQQPDSDC